MVKILGTICYYLCVALYFCCIFLGGEGGHTVLGQRNMGIIYLYKEFCTLSYKIFKLKQNIYSVIQETIKHI